MPKGLIEVRRVGGEKPLAQKGVQLVFTGSEREVEEVCFQLARNEEIPYSWVEDFPMFYKPILSALGITVPDKKATL